MVSLSVQKLLSLRWSHLSLLLLLVWFVVFCLYCLCFWCQIQNVITKQMRWSLRPLFSSRSIVVSDLNFFLIYFELIFVYDVTFLHVRTQLSQHHIH